MLSKHINKKNLDKFINETETSTYTTGILLEHECPSAHMCMNNSDTRLQSFSLNVELNQSYSIKIRLRAARIMKKVDHSFTSSRLISEGIKLPFNFESVIVQFV